MRDAEVYARALYEMLVALDEDSNRDVIGELYRILVIEHFKDK